MKKSKCYHLAQLAVASSLSLSAESKIEVLKVLILDEDTEALLEKSMEATEAEQDDKF